MNELDESSDAFQAVEDRRNVGNEMETLWKNIPSELADLILRFDGTIRKRHGKYFDQIPPYDARYNLLLTIPRPTKYYYDNDIHYVVHFNNLGWMSLTKRILSSGYQYKQPCRFNHGEYQIHDYQGIRYIVRNKPQREPVPFDAFTTFTASSPDDIDLRTSALWSNSIVSWSWSGNFCSV